MVLVEPDQFLGRLTSLFEANKAKGTVWITMKRCKVVPKTSANKDQAQKGLKHVVPTEPYCLVRATNGKKSRISTRVTHKDAVKFQIALSNMYKAYMDSLKKKERKSARTKKQ